MQRAANQLLLACIARFSSAAMATFQGAAPHLLEAIQYRSLDRDLFY